MTQYLCMYITYIYVCMQLHSWKIQIEHFQYLVVWKLSMESLLSMIVRLRKIYMALVATDYVSNMDRYKLLLFSFLMRYLPLKGLSFQWPYNNSRDISKNRSLKISFLSKLPRFRIIRNIMQKIPKVFMKTWLCFISENNVEIFIISTLLAVKYFRLCIMNRVKYIYRSSFVMVR